MAKNETADLEQHKTEGLGHYLREAATKTKQGLDEIQARMVNAFTRRHTDSSSEGQTVFFDDLTQPSFRNNDRKICSEFQYSRKSPLSDKVKREVTKSIPLAREASECIIDTTKKHEKLQDTYEDEYVDMSQGSRDDSEDIYMAPPPGCRPVVVAADDEADPSEESLYVVPKPGCRPVTLRNVDSTSGVYIGKRLDNRTEEDDPMALYSKPIKQQCLVSNENEFFSYDVEQLVGCLKLCGLPEFASICRQKSLDGSFFRNFYNQSGTIQRLHLSQNDLDKLKDVIRGWRPAR